MASSVDSYWWAADNVTSLCTADCTASAQSWDTEVQDKCKNQNIVVYGKLVPVDSVSGRYVDGLGIACLQAG